MFSFMRLIKANHALRAARQEIARLAVGEERLRFARDLHDLLGHSLSLITLKSELAHRLLPDSPERAAAEVADVERVARQALAEVREAVGGYRRTNLETELAGARVALEAAGIRWSAAIEAGPLPQEVEDALGWTVREGTTNVLRHSQARRCEVRVEREAATVTVKVVDDGRGAGTGERAGAPAAVGSRAWRSGSPPGAAASPPAPAPEVASACASSSPLPPPTPEPRPGSRAPGHYSARATGLRVPGGPPGSPPRRPDPSPAGRSRRGDRGRLRASLSPRRCWRLRPGCGRRSSGPRRSGP
jgi:two-component system sensor histidine kinase DesK